MHPENFPHLRATEPPRDDILRIWNELHEIDRTYIQEVIGDTALLANLEIDWPMIEAAATFWDPMNAVFDFNGFELTPTIEEYAALIQRSGATSNIVRPQFQPNNKKLAQLLGVRKSDLGRDLGHSQESESIKIKCLIRFIESRKLMATGEKRRSDLCHAFILLVVGTIYFPKSPALIDDVIADVTLQMVNGRDVEVALLAETFMSFDRIKVGGGRKLNGSPLLFQLWLMSHLKAFGFAKEAFYYGNGYETRITRLIHLVRTRTRKASEWIKYFAKLDLAQIEWRARWIRDSTRISTADDFSGIPLLGLTGATSYFPSRVLRQYGGLQTIPAVGNRWGCNIEWDPETYKLEPAIFQEWLKIEREAVYFPEHPTPEELHYQAASEYIELFHIDPVEYVPLPTKAPNSRETRDARAKQDQYRKEEAEEKAFQEYMAPRTSKKSRKGDKSSRMA